MRKALAARHTGPFHADRPAAGRRGPSLFPRTDVPGTARPGNAGVPPANGPKQVRNRSMRARHERSRDIWIPACAGMTGAGRARRFQSIGRRSPRPATTARSAAYRSWASLTRPAFRSTRMALLGARASHPHADQSRFATVRCGRDARVPRMSVANVRDRPPPPDPPDIAHGLRSPARRSEAHAWRPWVHGRPWSAWAPPRPARWRPWVRLCPARIRTKAGPPPFDAGGTPAFPGRRAHKSVRERQARRKPHRAPASSCGGDWTGSPFSIQ